MRRKHEITQEEISEILGLSRPTYSQIESGERELSISEAEKIAGIFNLSLNDFLVGKDSDKTKVILEKTHKKNKPLCNEIRDNRPQIVVDANKVEKFKQAILYILSKVGAKPNVGETVLYKLLYFIDFDFYEKFEEQILGATYKKNHYGPTPIEFIEIVKEMISNEELIQVKNKVFNYQQKKYLPLIEPNLDRFSAKELKHIDEVLVRFSDKTATWLSNYSHKDVPWQTAEDGEIIDYESVFYRTAETSVRIYDND